MINASRSNAPVTLQQIFDKIDRSPKDGASSRNEVKEMVKKAGVGGGLLGSIRINEATKAIMDGLDLNKDEQILFAELEKQLVEMLSQLEAPPAAGQPAQTVTEKVLAWFDLADTSDDFFVDQKEFERAAKKALDEKQQPQSQEKATIIAKVAIYLIANDPGRGISRQEATELAQDAEKRLPPARA